ncbi:MAG: hypothetical protein LBD35_01120 [Prevotellaceae bacterium]|jgi:hypothetical protein|nr:hypothetical protein [Prevotellaceae bacterium]
MSIEYRVLSIEYSVGTQYSPAGTDLQSVPLGLPNPQATLRSPAVMKIQTFGLSPQNFLIILYTLADADLQPFIV